MNPFPIAATLKAHTGCIDNKFYSSLQRKSSPLVDERSPGLEVPGATHVFKVQLCFPVWKPNTRYSRPAVPADYYHKFAGFRFLVPYPVDAVTSFAGDANSVARYPDFNQISAIAANNINYHAFK
jgi:hypothetical protein